MDVGGRLANAGIILALTVVVVGVGWLISIGMYALGLWPLGAILRIGVWLVAAWGLYWIIHHLRKSPSERLLEQVEAMREAEQRDLLD